MPPSLLTTALNSVFGPIVKQSAKWPPLLAYGLPGTIAVFLIIALGVVVSPSLTLLLALVILAPLAAYIFVDQNIREHQLGPIPRPNATIVFPKDEAIVGRTIYCGGFASGVQPPMRIWLAVQAMGFIWPKERDVFVRDSFWNHTIFEDGGPKKFSIVLLAAYPEGDKIIRDWLDAGKANGGEYAELKSIPGTETLARVDNLQIQ